MLLSRSDLPRAAPFGKGEVKRDPQARGVLGHLDLSVMKIGNSSNEAETEAVAGAVPAAFESIKPLEYVLAFLDRDPRTVIGH